MAQGDLGGGPGQIIARIPTVDLPEKNIMELIQTGDYVKAEADHGIVKL